MEPFDAQSLFHPPTGYFTEVASGDYYLEGGERPGEWLVLGGGRVKSEGVVTADALENVLDGWSRDKSRRLTQHHPRRQKGWDLTFSAPKSVSVLFALAPRSLRDLILSAKREAVIVALQYLVRNVLWTRRGKQGETYERVDKVMASLFTHITSRAADPDLHIHCLLANMCQRLDGTTGALWSREIYWHKMAIGAVYRTELAYQLQQKLGVIVRPVREWFEIKGIPKKLCEHFSKRSQEIRRIAREYGVHHPRFLELVAKVTAGVKGHLPHADLHRKWKLTAKQLGFPAARVLKLINHRLKELSENRAHRIAANAALQAINSLTERHSYFTERQILVAAAPHMIGKGKGADLLFAAVEIAKARLVTLDTPEQRYKHFTTLELYNTEKRIMNMVAQFGKAKNTQTISFGKLLPLLDKEFRKHGQAPESRPRRLSIEAAVRHLVCSKDNIRIISGEQGTGKTTALKLTKLALERAGYEVIGCAPTAAAAKELRKHFGGDVVTVASLLDSVNPTYQRRIRHAARMAWRQLRGKKTRRYKENRLHADEKIGHYLKQLQRVLRNKLPRYSGLIKLTKKTAIILDEAQKLSTRDAHDLIKAAQKSNSPIRIAYTLDSPSGGGAGGAIHHMAEELGVHTMNPDIQSEQEPWRRNAHQALRQGDPIMFFFEYRSSDALTISPTQKKTIQKVVKSWIKDKTPVKEKLVLASEPDEVRKLNRAIQKQRAKKLSVGRHGVKLANGEQVRRGDQVRFAKANRFLGVDAGDTGKVIRLTRLLKTPWRGKVFVRVDGKKRFGILPKVVTVNTKHYKDLTLGYACLPGQAQSQSTNVFVLLNPNKSNRESVLHQVTRAKKKTQLFVVSSDFEPTIDLLANSIKEKQSKIFAHQFEAQQRKSMQMTA